MKINWGVLGTASIARGCTIPGMLMAEHCNLYAIAGRSEAKAKAFAEEFGFEKYYEGYDRLLEDEKVDAVYVPLPNDIHKEWVIKALRAGKHILCEKPLAMNANEAKEMYAVAKECGKILMEAYAYLHTPYVAALKDIVKSGTIGNVKYIESAFVTQGYHEDFRLYKEKGGGAVYDLGCYCTTMILSLIDSEITYVKGDAEFSDLGVDLQSAVIMGFENGTRASFNVGMILGKDSNARFDRLYICGDKGYVKSDVEYNQQGELSFTVVSEGVKEIKTVSVSQNYALEVENLCLSILGEETPLVTPEFSIKNSELLGRILKEIGYY